MKALLFSDSHGDVSGIRYLSSMAWPRTGHIDAYFHMGDGCEDMLVAERVLRDHDPDCRIYRVRGNCDYFVPDLKDEQVVEFGGAKIYMTHGHRHSVKTTLSILDDAAVDAGCSIALYGHTHAAAMDMRSTLLINPGSVMNERIGFLEVEDGRPRIQLLYFG
ncbi:MAG: YfcE family phosphodiesterase [Clostridia bacterium]|nr:YfcE family phosphodiesterase [Clostridia bacterium]